MIKRNRFTHTLLLTLALVVLALALRVPQLGTFFTADEFLWVDRSRNFLGGLLSSDFDCLLPHEDKTNAVPGQGLACTLRTGHPGVVTMWTGSLGIWLQWLTRPETDTRTLLQFVEQLPNNPVEQATIAPVRLPTAILTSLFVGVFYLLLRRLLTAEIALLAGLLLALNPFHIALSRVLHHDALSTSFIITSTLSLLIYFGVDRRRRWLLLAGCMAGLAMLTKSTGFFLIPYAGLIALWSLAARWGRGEVQLAAGFRQTVIDGLLWAGATALTFGLVWPAMWVVPLQALTTIFVIGFKYASGGHAKGVLFLNNISQDPGPWFYPVTWLFRTHLWVMAGVLLTIFFAVRTLPRRTSSQPRLRGWLDRLSLRGFDDNTGLLIWVGAFLFFFMIAMTLGEKKQDRYILPIYPLLDLVAAVGLFTLLRQVRGRVLLLAGVLVVNLTLIVPQAPYYFTYYNPLLGGIKSATKAITVGWGEGLNLAAAHLNRKPNAERLRVSTWYGSTFAPFFKGETIRYSDQKGNALGGEYVVFYLNQRQRDFPDGEIWHYFTENFTLDQTISLAGVEYAWIFTGPAIDHFVEDQSYRGIAALLGWDWSGDINPDHSPVAAGERLPYALFWEYLGKTPEEDFFLRLIGPDGGVWAESISRPAPQFAEATVWRSGQIIEEQGSLTIPADTPPGSYSLQIGFYTAAPAVTSGELIFPTAMQPLDTPLQTITVGPAITPASTEGSSLLDLLLVNPTPLDLPPIDSALTFDLIWQAPLKTPHTYQAAFALLDQAGVERWRWSARPLVPFLSTVDWPTARRIRSQWSLPLTGQTPGGAQQLQLILRDEAGKQVQYPLGLIDLPGRVRSFALPQPVQPHQATFEQAIAILGLDGGEQPLLSGQSLPLTLYWQSLAPLGQDYTSFVQLLGPDGQVVAQQDKAPLDGQAPTSTWTPGEVIADSFSLPLPDTLPPGSYRLISGFYQFETGQRLVVDQTGVDFVALAEWVR